MFETVAPEAFKARSHRVFIRTLPASIAVHLLAIATVMAARVWTVTFPEQSPKVSVAYSLTQIPDPPPPPPPPPKPVEVKPQPIHSAPAPPPLAPVQVVAPTVIPDVIPVVLPPQPAPPPPPIAAPVAAVPAASPNGVAGGKPGGTGRALGGEGITLGDDGRVYVDRKVKVPMKEIAHEYPHYPDAAKKVKLEGSNVVRYTIDKSGRVRDITFLTHANSPLFDDETVKTVQAWRYQPMTIDGKPVEVVHEIEVSYEFTVR